MATNQEIKYISELFEKNKTKKVFQEIERGEKGIFAVHKYIYIYGGNVTSKEISTAMNVSSARMTILLQKLENKGIIIKSSSTEDARAIKINLTEKGIKKYKEIRKEQKKIIGELIDEFGIEQLEELLTKIDKIHEIFVRNIKNIKGGKKC